ncbi:MAG: class I SAM-dependent methyltransferase [Planctomycetota bacterium]
MLDTLLYDTRRRRAVIAVLASVLVLGVGFVAIGTSVGSASFLVVFGVAFLAIALGSLGKLLVVSHVHLRGTIERLESLNDRYDGTAAWLERFDADVRESIAAAASRLDSVAATLEAHAKGLDDLQADRVRQEDVASVRNDLEKASSDLRELLADRIGTVDAALDAVGRRIDAVGKRIDDASKSHSDQVAEVDRRVTESTERIDALGALADGLGQRLDASEAEASSTRAGIESSAERLVSRFEARTDQLEAELKAGSKDLAKRVATVDDTHERKRRAAVQSVKQAAMEGVQRVEKRAEAAAGLASRLRGDGYVQFPRIASQELVKDFEALRVGAKPAEIRYLERKLQTIEGVCEGRLAGSADDAIARVLAGRLAKTKDLAILEIGVLFGIGAAFMHSALIPHFRRVKLTLIDPFEGYYGAGHRDPLTGLPVTRDAVKRNLQRVGVAEDDAVMLEGLSTDAQVRDAAERHGPYGVVVIDGDHSADGVRADYEGFADMLRTGGILVIDDYGSDDWPAVTEFVDGTIKADERFKLLTVIGKTALFKRQRSSSKKKKASASESARKSPTTPEPGEAQSDETRQSGRKGSDAKGRDDAASNSDVVQAVVTTTKRKSARRAVRAVEPAKG